MIYLVFRRAAETAIILATVPLGLSGGIWLIWWLGQAVSVASVIGFIALAGVTAEFGVVMMLYLENAWSRTPQHPHLATVRDLDRAIHEGALQRVRPISMTVAVILAGLLPILFGSGAGSEVMQRIAAPMVGGMITAPLMSMLMIPAAFHVLQRYRLHQAAQTPAPDRAPL